TMYLGYGSNSTGRYDMSGGSLSLNQLNIGWNGGGTFTLSGGVLATASPLSTYLAIHLGSNAGSVGSMTISGGLVSYSNMDVGYYGIGVVNQTGGSVYAAPLIVGVDPGSGSYTLSNGSLLSPIGIGQRGTFLQNGGTV